MLLTELRMGQADLQATLTQLGGKSLIGFEVETYGFLSDKILDELKLVKPVSDLKSIEEILDYFQLSSNGQKRFVKDLKLFWKRKADEWVEEHWENFIDGDIEDISKEDYLQARDRADDYFHSKHDIKSLKEFYEEEFGNVPDNVIEHYLMTPIGGWYRTDVMFYTDRNIQLQAASVLGLSATGAYYSESIASVSDSVKKEAFYSEIYEELNRITGGAIRSVEDDGSIRPRSKMYGAEIITKPLRADRALDVLNQIFEWMKSEAFETNESTGLHINISIDDVKQVDWLKLGLMLGEQYEMFKWKREKNVYTQSQMGNLVDKLKMSSISPADIAQGGEKFDKAVEILNQNIDRTKYRTFNVLHMDDEGYVEFRIAGGKNYHDNMTLVEQSALRYLRALHAASDKNAYRKEYIKKVYALLANSADFEQAGQQGDVTLEQQLTKLWKASTGTATAFDEKIVNDPERATDAVARIAVFTAGKLIANNLKPNPAVRRLLITAARKYGVDDNPNIVGQIAASLGRVNNETNELVTHKRDLALSLMGL